MIEDPEPSTRIYDNNGSYDFIILCNNHTICNICMGI